MIFVVCRLTVKVQCHSSEIRQVSQAELEFVTSKEQCAGFIAPIVPGLEIVGEELVVCY